MRRFAGLEEGEITTALVCFTDIAGFTRFSEQSSLQDIVALLKKVSAIISQHVDRTAGAVVKYIGDASLLVFPEEDTDRSIGELLEMQRSIHAYFASNHLDLSITFSAHIGPIIVVRLQPIEDLDIHGHTVNHASRLGSQAPTGGFVVSREVYDRLAETTRRAFRQADTTEVFLAGGRR
jgi:adenylate cyclase